MHFPLLSSALAELFGSAFFFSAVLSGVGPWAIAISLLAVCFIFASSSFTHFNSSISAMMYLKGDINLTELIVFVIAQLIGAVLALLWWQYTKGGKNIMSKFWKS
jgi:glycerol uptake facilitator-like aquaporin